MQTNARLWTSRRGGRVLVAGMLGIIGLAVGLAPLTASAGGEKCAAAMRVAKEKAAREKAAEPAPASLSVLPSYGPPMVCHEVLIGKAKSLPWEGGHGGSDAKYEIARVPADAEEILRNEKSVLVRMETMRRAAIYLTQGKHREDLMWELIGRRAGMVMFGEASGKNDPRAWFDVGYFIGCLNQLGVEEPFRFATADEVPGYLFVERAFELAKKQNWKSEDLAQMQFGAAIMTHPAMRHKDWNYAIGTKDDIYDQYILGALKSGKGDELLETNIAAHLKTFGKSIDDVRKMAAR